MKSKKQKLKEKCVKIAIQIKLRDNPDCVFCGRKAATCHHFIHQSRSNYLRTKLFNLISICALCHYRLHSGYESIMTGELINKYGWRWFEKLREESNVKIKDTLGYWQIELERLNKIAGEDKK